MKTLITGGAGFIGSHLTDRLLERGDHVLVIDNYATCSHDNLTPNPHLRVIEGTIADATLVQNLFEEFHPDIVIHAAASYKGPSNWVEDVRTNALGTVHVVGASQRHEVDREDTQRCTAQPCLENRLSACKSSVGAHSSPVVSTGWPRRDVVECAS